MRSSQLEQPFNIPDLQGSGTVKEKEGGTVRAKGMDISTAQRVRAAAQVNSQCWDCMHKTAQDQAGQNATQMGELSGETLSSTPC